MPQRKALRSGNIFGLSPEFGCLADSSDQVGLLSALINTPAMVFPAN